MIAVIDYGMGNLRSVSKALEKVGGEAEVVRKAEGIEKAEALVLPGVGAFSQAMENLKSLGMVEPLRQAMGSGKLFLGICLGLQLLLEKSYEEGEHRGLGVLAGDVVRVEPAEATLKVPHVGWSQLRMRPGVPLFAGVAEGAHVYFVHSYYVRPAGDVVAVGRDMEGYESPTKFPCIMIEVVDKGHIRVHKNGQPVLDIKDDEPCYPDSFGNS